MSLSQLSPSLRRGQGTGTGTERAGRVTCPGRWGSVRRGAPMTRRGTPASLSRHPGTPGGRHPHAVGAESSSGPAGASMLVTLTAADLRALVFDAVADVLAELAPGAEPPSDVLTRSEAARFLRCSLTQLDRLCRDGGLPFHLLGESRRFLRSELVAYVGGAQPVAMGSPSGCAPHGSSCLELEAPSRGHRRSGHEVPRDVIPSTCEGSR